MVSKLVFKGDKPKKKKQKSAVSIDSSRISKNINGKSSSNGGISHYEEDDGWISAKSIRDLSGPIVIGLSDDDTPIVIASDMNGKLYLTSDVDITDATCHGIEPRKVQQVFVLSKLDFQGASASAIGEQPLNNEFAFKSAEGTYLTAPLDPPLNSKAISIGQDQIFILDVLETGGWSIRTSRNKFLSLRPDKESDFGYSLVYSDSVGFQETWTLRVQAQYARKQRKIALLNGSSNKISNKVLEERAGRSLSDDEISILRRAYKEGRLNEALLDIRQKSRSDNMC